MKKEILKTFIRSEMDYKKQMEVFMHCTKNGKEYDVAELEDKLQRAEPGDTVVIGNGTYTDFQLIFSSSGVKGNKITLRAETPGRVFLTGSSFIQIRGSYVVLDGFVFREGYYLKEGSTDAAVMLGGSQSSHNTMRNVTFDGYNPPEKSMDVRWLRVYGEHNRIHHNTFIRKNSQGLMLEVVRPSGSTAPNYALIDHNYFGFFEEGVDNGAETLRIGTSHQSQTDSFSVVEFNVFEECDGEIEFISNKSGGNIYRNNTVINTLGNLTLRHGNSCTVENNVFLNPSGRRICGGVRVMDKDHIIRNNYFEGMSGTSYRYSGVSLEYGVVDSPLNRYFEVIDAKILNNTFVDNKTSIVNGVDKTAEKTLPPDHTSIKSNFFVGQEKAVTIIDDGINTVFKNNYVTADSVSIPDAEGLTVEVIPYRRNSAGLVEPVNPALKGVGASLTTFTQRGEVGASYNTHLHQEIIID